MTRRLACCAYVGVLAGIRRSIVVIRRADRYLKSRAGVDVSTSARSHGDAPEIHRAPASLCAPSPRPRKVRGRVLATPRVSSPSCQRQRARVHEVTACAIRWHRPLAERMRVTTTGGERAAELQSSMGQLNERVRGMNKARSAHARWVQGAGILRAGRQVPGRRAIALRVQDAQRRAGWCRQWRSRCRWLHIPHHGMFRRPSPAPSACRERPPPAFAVS